MTSGYLSRPLRTLAEARATRTARQREAGKIAADLLAEVWERISGLCVIAMADTPFGKAYNTAIGDALRIIEELQAGEETPEPCTSAARAQGCTCWMPPAHSAQIDPPEPRIDPGCELHGDKRDPSDLYKERRDNEQDMRRFAPIEDDDIDF